MKTDDLIDLLARGAGPAPRALAARRLAPAAGLGVAASALLAVGLFGPIPADMYGSPAPWIKLTYAVCLAIAAAWLTARLARPVARLVAPLRAVLAVFAVMGAVGLATLFGADPGDRATALLGQSWSTCSWSVLALSMPGLACALWAVRGMAPTRPVAAGFAAGLFAGALGALGYALSCLEVSPAFVALWYTLGIGMSGVVGALLGPLVLRW
jgi:hypothetical protein